MPDIKLDKNTKTIKVVNRRDTIKIVNRKKEIDLKHTGKKGPKGDQGDQGEKGETGISTFVRVHHGADETVARPSSLYVEWVGNVAPLNATVEDTWINAL